MQLGGTGFGQCHSFFMGARVLDADIKLQGVLGASRPQAGGGTPQYLWFFCNGQARHSILHEEGEPWSQQ